MIFQRDNMSSKVCPACQKTFTRVRDMKRHHAEFHREKMSNISPSEPSTGLCMSTTLLHPFTMCFTGPTGCGKTHLLKQILLSGASIAPKPQRIIYLYNIWQPYYDELRARISPQPEFLKGIPDNLDEDTFLNPRVRNLLCIDDLAASCKTDTRINNLFTEGSHHRNLSVITINQNLYHSKDPTQRRNCHYLVLFNNPIDQQLNMTLGRQMYPNNSQFFVKTFLQAVEKPYGYLLIDLKPQTRQEDRLRPNGLNLNGDGVIQKRTHAARHTLWSDIDSDPEDDEPMGRPHCMPRKREKRFACEKCGAIASSVRHLINHTRLAHM